METEKRKNNDELIAYLLNSQREMREEIRSEANKLKVIEAIKAMKSKKQENNCDKI